MLDRKHQKLIDWLNLPITDRSPRRPIVIIKVNGYETLCTCTVCIESKESDNATRRLQRQR